MDDRDLTGSGSEGSVSPGSVAASLRAALPPDFFESYWRRRALLIPGGAAAFQGVLTSEDVDAVHRLVATTPEEWLPEFKWSPSLVAVNYAQRLSPALAALCRDLRTELQWPDVNLAVFRNHSRSTKGPHYDPQDVFLCQLEGSKHWQFWSSEMVGTDDLAKHLERHPDTGGTSVPSCADRFEVVTAPGDLLYVPLCWGHSGWSAADGLTLSILVNARSVQSVAMDWIRHYLATETHEFAPLPIPLEADDWADEVPRHLVRVGAIADDLGRSSAAGRGPGFVRDLIATAAVSTNDRSRAAPKATLLVRSGDLTDRCRVEANRFVVLPEQLAGTPLLPAPLADWMGWRLLERVYASLKRVPNDAWTGRALDRLGAIEALLEPFSLDDQRRALITPDGSTLVRRALQRMSDGDVFAALGDLESSFEGVRVGRDRAGVTVTWGRSGDLPAGPDVRNSLDDAINRLGVALPSFRSALEGAGGSVVAGRRSESAPSGSAIHVDVSAGADELDRALLQSLVWTRLDWYRTLVTLAVPGATTPVPGKSPDDIMLDVSALQSEAAWRELDGRTAATERRWNLAHSMLAIVDDDLLTTAGRRLFASLSAADAARSADG